jgi:hypothetical protein
MKLVSGFLERFSKLQAPERVVIEAVQEILKEKYNYQIPKECVRVGKDFVGLSLPSVVRSEVFTDRHAILAAINHKLGSQRIFELR